MRKRFAVFAVFAGLMLAPAVVLPAEDYTQVQAAIGMETAAGGARYTVSQIARIAAANGIEVIITADAFLNRWQYGLWPLRNIIRKTEEARSVSTYGIDRYFDEIDAVQRGNPGMVVIGGVEVAPFYCWEGSPFKGNFAIKDWHKHLLVIGLENRKDIAGLPVIGNCNALAKPCGIKGILCLLMAVGLLMAGLYGVRQGMLAQEGFYERRFGLLLGQWRYAGIALMIAGAIVFANYCPFRDQMFDQYRGSLGKMPYQNLINYVKNHGGMTFWAHPEAKNVEKIGKVDIQTGEHADLLLETCGYTAFAIFSEGYDIAGRPHGAWDNVLRRYCQGGCPSPVWAIGFIDYERDRDLGADMNNLRTVLLVKEKTARGVLDAMRSGRAYVAKDANAARFRLERFTVGDSLAPEGAEAAMGQEIAVSGPPRIRIKGDFAGSAAKPPLKILIIRDGEVIARMDKDAPFDVTYDDTAAEGAGKHYYRAEIRSEQLVAVTNPVFVTGR